MGLVKINSEGNKIYTIEGSVGAGKSTLGIELAATGLVGFVPEPLNIWQTRYEDNLLEKFYDDKKRYAFTFQLAAFTTRAKTWEDVLSLLDHSHIFLDRSVYSDRYIFAKSLNNQGLMDSTEYKIYTDLWDWMVGNWCVVPDKIIYVRTPPEICLEWVKERARDEEASVPIEYLIDLHDRHEEWLADKEDVIILDGSTPIDIEPLLEELNIT